MNYKERAAFRKTDAWHKWKAKCRLHTSKDFITKDPLCHNWNLHHLDLNVQHYDHIDDMKRFMPLNPKTHEVIHELFKWYKKDHKVLDRIKKTLDMMEEYTGEQTYKGNGTTNDTTRNTKPSEKIQTQKDRKYIPSVKR